MNESTRSRTIRPYNPYYLPEEKTGSAVKISRLLPVLTKLQKEPSIEEAGDLHQVILEGLKRFGGGSIQIDHEELRVIHTTDLVFQKLAEERLICTTAKAVLLKLRIPVVKSALMNPGFFQHKSLPARILLNDLALAMRYWEPEPDLARDAFYNQIQAVVNFVLHSYERDDRIFSQAWQKLKIFLQQQSSHFQVVEQRTLQSCRGDDRRAHIERQLNRIYEQRFGARKIPLPLREILLGPWRAYLTRVLLQKDQWAWKQADMAMAYMARLSHPHHNKDPLLTQILAKIKPSLIAALEAMHAAPEAPESQVNRYLEDLRHCALNPQDPLTVGEIPPPACPPMEPDGNRWGKLGKIPVGTWFGFVDSLGRVSRGKLCWKSEPGEKLVFSNRKGVKTSEWSLAELTRELQNGKAFVMDLRPPLDRIIQTIDHQAKNQFVAA